MKKILISYYSEAGWQGDIVAYKNKLSNQVISKEAYDEMIEREIKKLWDISTKAEKEEEYGSFENFRENMLRVPEPDFEPLVEFVVDDDEDLEKYEPYILL